MLVDNSRGGAGGTIFVQQAAVAQEQPATPDPNFRRLSPWQKEAESFVPPQMTVSTENYNRLVRMIQQGEKLKMTVNVEAQYLDGDGMVNNTVAEIPGTDPKLLATVTADPSATVIRPRRLTSAAAADLVEATFGRAPDAVLVEALMQATRGTPFLLRDLVDALHDEGIAPTAEAVADVERIGPRTVGRSLRRRLGRLPAPALQIAEAWSVLGESDLSTAARLANLDEDVAAEAAEQLVSAAVIQAAPSSLTFVHAIVREGIYSELTSIELAHAHRRAARLVAQQPSAHEAVAEHLLLAEPTGDDLEQAFRDDPKLGLELLDASFREPIWRYIKAICRSLSPEDTADVYQNALLELVRIVRQPGFDPTRPMRIVNKVVKERTVDFARRRHKRLCYSLDQIVHLVAEDMRDTRIGSGWKLLPSSSG